MEVPLQWAGHPDSTDRKGIGLWELIPGLAGPLGPPSVFQRRMSALRAGEASRKIALV